MKNKWRFPSANHGDRKGISSGDSEAFKKTPYSAFAREILQNSIDAQFSNEEPVKVIFNLFSLNSKEIPGIEELKTALRRCKDYWRHKTEYISECDKIENTLNQTSISCLRVSDYNTTGLIGVESNEMEGNHFLALTRGTGISEKDGEVAGGSKGMGKNAVFLMSKAKTVFYSTRTTHGINKTNGIHIGSVGVADFISGYIDDDLVVNNRDYTQGKGYFGSDEFNNAITENLILDSTDNKRIIESGTDIFIIGFRDNGSWQKEVINSILDSFMAAIVRGQLEVDFNNIKINKKTIREVVYSDIIANNNKSNIVSQYRLLTDGENVKLFDIETEYGTCELRILPYNKDEDHLATHKCAMVRHPLMKIKDEPLGASFRVSAMCMINDGTLGKVLRSIENPQHIDWEPKRIQDDPDLKKELDYVIKQIKIQISEKVIECLQLGDTNPLDPYGAGDFLPDVNFGDSPSMDDINKIFTDKSTVTPPKEVKPIERNVNQESDDGQGLQPDVGNVDDFEDGDVEHPSGYNESNDGELHGGDESGKQEHGNNVIVVRSKLAGVRYKFMSLNKVKGKNRIIFIAPLDVKECYLNLRMLDDSNNQDYVSITELECNGISIEGNNPHEFGPFSIHQNEKIILDFTTNIKGYFASSIKIVCIDREVK